jgi:aldose 1-epimerase
LRETAGAVELVLNADDAQVSVLPASGGALGHWRLGNSDILRPRVAGSSDPTDFACFVMVPFSNIISGSKLRFRNEVFPLPLNHPKEPLPIHGDGWLREWSVTRATKSAAELHYDHDGAQGFPFRYGVTQSICIDGTTLSLSLQLENTDTCVIPAGLGFHPYFLRSRNARLTVGHAGLWSEDKIQPDKRFLQSDPLLDHAIDDCFAGWQRTACLTLPEHDRKILISASSSASALVVYAPRAANFICIEPVTHVNDGINALASGSELTGIQLLEPGRSMRLEVRFQVFRTRTDACCTPIC